MNPLVPSTPTASCYKRRSGIFDVSHEPVGVASQQVTKDSCDSRKWPQNLVIRQRIQRSLPKFSTETYYKLEVSGFTNSKQSSSSSCIFLEYRYLFQRMDPRDAFSTTMPKELKLRSCVELVVSVVTVRSSTLVEYEPPICPTERSTACSTVRLDEILR